MAPTSEKFAGKVTVPPTLLMVTTLSSRGLTERFQCGVTELRELVQEQHPPVAQGNLAGPGKTSASYEARVGDRIVGRPEGTLDHQRPILGQQAPTLYILVTSRDSCEVIRGKMEGIARASRVFPAPGGPLISRLCPPAAATSRARFACSCPLIPHFPYG